MTNFHTHICIAGLVIYALAQSTAIIPCTCKNWTGFRKSQKCTWIRDGTTLEGYPIGDDGSLILKDVGPSLAGVYSCEISPSTSINEDNLNFTHELQIITLPMYKIETTILYNLKNNCNQRDEEVIYTYLPSSVRKLLCGDATVCNVYVHRPICIKKKHGNYLKVTLLATMDRLSSMIQSKFQHKCSVDCKFKIYNYITLAVLENVNVLSTMTVLSEADSIHLELQPASRIIRESNINMTQLIITCPAGYGLKDGPICAPCPTNTFSPNDESYCRQCPLGEYQISVGSNSCIVCSSPMENRRCLNILYSDSSLFDIYVGVAFGISVFIILIPIIYTSRSNRMNQDQREYIKESKRSKIPRKKLPRSQDISKTKIQENVLDVPEPDFPLN